jgi:hypothetical protein
VSESCLRDAILSIIGVDEVRPLATKAQIYNLRQRVVDAFDDQMAAIGRSMENCRPHSQM